LINALECLRQHSRVAADTGDFLAIKAYQPEDATTNPSLILKAVLQEPYRAILRAAAPDPKVPDALGPGGDRVKRQFAEAETPLADQIDKILVHFGLEMLSLVPGRVSTEVDARLSFDSGSTFSRAMALTDRYVRAGVAAHRVLIKIAATWEGIEAAQRLEQRGVRCNLTLVFSLTQARACADAGVQLISPFVGRITDWFKHREGRDFAAHEDPGVNSVRRIHRYLKVHHYPTEIMGASFRNPQQVLALAGCDLLTISPAVLGQLQAMDGPVERQLCADPLADLLASKEEREEGGSLEAPVHRIDRPAPLNEAQFRWELNEDAMASEKLAEGIRIFAADCARLEGLLAC
jgi:transaldolase